MSEQLVSFKIGLDSSGYKAALAQQLAEQQRATQATVALLKEEGAALDQLSAAQARAEAQAKQARRARLEAAAARDREAGTSTNLLTEQARIQREIRERALARARAERAVREEVEAQAAAVAQAAAAQKAAAARTAAGVAGARLSVAEGKLGLAAAGGDEVAIAKAAAVVDREREASWARRLAAARQEATLAGDVSILARATAAVEVEKLALASQRVSQEKAAAAAAEQAAAAAALAASPGGKLDALGSLRGGMGGSAATLTADLKRAEGAARDLGGGLAVANQKLVALGQARAHVAGLYGELNRVAGVVTKIGLAVVGGAAAGAAKLSQQGLLAYGQREADMAALTSVMGDRGQAESHFERLREISKAPGIDIQGALTASLGLQGAGFGDAEVERYVAAMGKAVAASGKGAESFKLVQLAITQMASKTNLSGEEIRQLSEQLPGVGAALEKAFGTRDTEKIRQMGVTGTQAATAIIGEFEKMRGTQSGLLNAFDNIKTAWHEVLIGIGKGLVSGGADDRITAFATKLEGLSGSAEKFGAALVPVLNRLVGMADWLVANEGANAKWVAGLGLSVGALMAVGGLVAKVSFGLVQFSKAMALVGVTGPKVAAGLKPVTAAVGGLTKSLAGFLATPWGVGLVGLAAITAGLAHYAKGAREAAAATRETATAYGAHLDDMAKRGYLSQADAQKSKAPAAPSAWDTFWGTKKARDYDAWLGSAAPKLGRATAGQSVREEQAAAAAKEASVEATTRQKANLEGVAKIEAARVGLLNRQVALEQALGSGIEAQTAQLDRLQARQRTAIQAKLDAARAAAEKEEDEDARAALVQQAEIEAEGELLELETERAKLTAELAARRLKGVADLRGAEAALAQQRHAGLLKTASAQAAVIGSWDGWAARERASIEARLAAALEAARREGDLSAAASARLEAERALLGLSQQRADLVAELAERELSGQLAVLDAKRGVVQAQMAANADESAQAALRAKVRALQEQQWSRELQLANLKRQTGQDAVAYETATLRIQAERIAAAAAEREAQRAAAEKQRAALDGLQGARVQYAEAMKRGAEARGDQRGAAYWDQQRQQGQAVLDQRALAWAGSPLEKMQLLTEQATRKIGEETERYQTWAGARQAMLSGAGGAVAGVGKLLPVGAASGGGWGGELSAAAIGGDSGRVADILGRARGGGGAPRSQAERDLIAAMRDGGGQTYRELRRAYEDGRRLELQRATQVLRGAGR